MQSWTEIDIEQYQKELIDQAHMDQLAREVLRDQPHHNPALAWVGHRIAALGLKLTHRRNDEHAPDVSLN